MNMKTTTELKEFAQLGQAAYSILKVYEGQVLHCNIPPFQTSTQMHQQQVHPSKPRGGIGGG